MARRINAHLVVGGWWHDFDYARLQLLQLLGEHRMGNAFDAMQNTEIS